MPAKTDDQGRLFDRTVENPELEQAIADMLEAKEDAKEPMKTLRTAKKTLDGLVETVQLEDGERLRVGRFVVFGKARSGGGFEVPQWSKVFAGKIEDLGVEG